MCCHYFMKISSIRRFSGKDGVILVYAAIIGFLFIALLGLVINKSYIQLSLQKLQDTADSAALGAAMALVDDSGDSLYTSTRTAAMNLGSYGTVGGSSLQLAPNYSNASTGDIVVGLWDEATEAFTADVANPNAVKVTAGRTASSNGGELNLFFGGTFTEGSTTLSASLSRSAIAFISNVSIPSILVLSSIADKSLEIKGSSVLSIVNGSLHVNSSHSCAIKGSGSKYLVSASYIGVRGGVCANESQFTPMPTTGAASVPDPFIDLAEPSSSGLPDLGKMNKNGEYGPGKYKSIDLKNEDVNLLPGLYYVEDKVKLTGNSSLVGTGVLIFLEDGKFEIEGNSEVDVTPIDSGVYQDFVLFMARDNVGDVVLSGNCVVSLAGIVYAQDSRLYLKSGGDSLFGQVVCDRVKTQGDSTTTVTGGFGSSLNSQRFLLVR
jgi:Flp pilus assembly protein TadG